jgi:hypothetical protein
MVSHDPHLEWKTLGEEPVVRTPWFQLGLADVQLPDGRRIDHYLFRVPPVVLTAMQDDQDRVLLILRYRFSPSCLPDLPRQAARRAWLRDRAHGVVPAGRHARDDRKR